MAAFTSASMNLTGAGLPERLEGALATTELFSTLGVQALLGRTFLSTDADGPSPGGAREPLCGTVAFGGDPNVLGRTVILDETPHVIVGVMPPTSTFPADDGLLDAVSNSTPTPTKIAPTRIWTSSRAWRPGVTVDQARAELRLIATQLERQYPEGQREDQRDGRAAA